LAKGGQEGIIFQDFRDYWWYLPGRGLP